MLNVQKKFLDSFTDPIKEIEAIRTGVSPDVIEKFLAPQAFAVKDILERLDIAPSTYKAKKKNKSLLDSSSTEKLMRLISVINLTSDILGENEAKEWLYKNISSLGNQKPIDLLDTEAGHRLVEQALLQIKYGVYS